MYTERYWAKPKCVTKLRRKVGDEVIGKKVRKGQKGTIVEVMIRVKRGWNGNFRDTYYRVKWNNDGHETTVFNTDVESVFLPVKEWKEVKNGL